MKRALAERAKQQTQQHQTSPDPPPTKVARLSAPHPRRNSAGGIGHDARISQLADEVTSATADASDPQSFYLKHQNRALATELRSLQHAVQILEQERNYRRQHCLAACQALHSLQATWTQLETALLVPNGSPTSAAAAVLTTDPSAPASTTTTTTTTSASGVKSSVEWTKALADALAILAGRTSSNHQHLLTDHGGTTSDSVAMVDHFYADLSQLTADVAARASVLQEWITTVMMKNQPSTLSNVSDGNNNNNDSNGTSDPSVALPIQESGALSSSAPCSMDSQVRMLNAQVEELEMARQQMASRERRLRRNLYRMAAGMLTQEQVMRTLEVVEDDTDGIASQVKQEALLFHHHQQQQHQQSLQIPETSAGSIKPDESSSKSSTMMDGGAQLEALEIQIAHWKQIVANRDESIQELTEKIKEKDLLINHLSLTQQSEDDAQRLQSLEPLEQQLKLKNDQIRELEAQIGEIKQRWAQALGNEKAAMEALDEQLKKFEKRWAEFTSTAGLETGDDGDADHNSSVVSPLQEQLINQTTKITELQHKLDQAVENVRQAEVSRINLKEALEMNHQLQAKLDEMSAKYAQSSRSNTASSSAGNPTRTADHNEMGSLTTGNNSGSNNHTTKEAPPSSKDHSNDRSSSSSLSGEKYEKMYKEYRRVKKEVGALTSYREAAKAKIEKLEKERDTLSQTNARLLRQSAEKDEMNAKSLSTILHLKSLTEQLTLGKDSLDQEAKSASQLALAARLATKAKGRVTEEVQKENKALQEKLESLEKEHASTKIKLQNLKCELSEGSGEITLLRTKLSNSMKRCDELVAENEAKAAEIRGLVDSLDRAEREAGQAKEKLGQATTTSGVGVSSGKSAFTVDQLNTQISVLKSRLACPVCHYRDKECIIMRCRHMHCKQCVEERITNRSRKCPTCNNKFSEKDVEDVWLS